MSITVGFWAIPALLTVALWAWAYLADKGQSGGDYAFGPVILGVFHGLLALIGTLTVWLTYFILVSIH